MAAQRFSFGSFVLDMQRGALVGDGRAIPVGYKGLCLLHALVQAPSQAMSKAALMDAAWPDAVVEESNLSVQIAALRKLLGPQPDGRGWIETIPRVGYRFAGDVAMLDESDRAGTARGAVPSASPASSASQASPTAVERPSIAVMPFANVSGSREQEYLADGIAEDIITALTRYRWFRVIGRNSSFVYKGRTVDSKQVARELGVHYVLEGSVRRSGEQVRISVQLVDAASASQIWAERYAMGFTEIFAVQDAIAERVAGAIEPELLKIDALPVGPRHSGNITAWNLVRQGTWCFHHISREMHLEARELFRQAGKLDPELAEAHSWLARVGAGIVAYGWSAQPADDIREAVDAALRAIRLDEKNPYSHYALAISSAYANAPEQAVLAAENAIEINPSFALGHLVLGMSQLFRGDAQKAIAPLERGLTLSAHDPQGFVWYNLLAVARLLAGQAEAALAAAIKARKARPAWRPAIEALACAYAALGRMEEARACVAEMRRLDKPPGDILAPLRVRSPQWAGQMDSLLESVSRAGGA